MEKRELYGLIFETATKEAQEIYESEKDKLPDKFSYGYKVYEIPVNKGEDAFNWVVCKKLKRLFTKDGYYCEIDQRVAEYTATCYVYPVKPKPKKWWQKILFG